MLLLLDHAVVHLLHTVYTRGPNWQGFGFWGGKAHVDICASMTNTSSGLWLALPDFCDKYIYDRVYNFYLFTRSLVVIGALVYLSCGLMQVTKTFCLYKLNTMSAIKDGFSPVPHTPSENVAFARLQPQAVVPQSTTSPAEETLRRQQVLKTQQEQRDLRWTQYQNKGATYADLLLVHNPK
jgi:hypothetical protein